MLKRVKTIMWILLTFFVVVYAAELIMNTTDYQLNYEFWSVLPASLMLFSIIGLISYVLYMLYIKSAAFRVLGSVFAFFSLLFFGFMAIWESENVVVMESGVHKIYILEHRFLFGGHDRLYEKENAFYSKYVAGATVSDNNSVSYEFDDDVLVVTETWPHYQEDDYIEIEYYSLKNTN